MKLVQPRQFKFPEYWSWPVHHIPDYWKERLTKRIRYCQSLEMRSWVIPVDAKIMREFVKTGSNHHPRGHSFRKCDNPKRGEKNQLVWLRYSRLPSCGLNSLEHLHHLATLLQNGYMEQRRDRNGARYRVSLSGLSWLKEQCE